MKMATQGNQEVYAHDEFGHLVRFEDETDEQYLARTARVLHEAGLSANDPFVVTGGNVDEIENPTATISALTPNTAASGSADVTLGVAGTGFTDTSVIVFAGNDEPTTVADPNTLTTIVKPSLFAPATVQVGVRNGGVMSNTMDFTFT